MSELLRDYLQGLQPAPPAAVTQVTTPRNLSVPREGVTALLLGIYDFVVPPAY